ncbi:MAG: glycosyltransferase family 9 protein [Deltaproteobacteria bacterium]|nr:glycosyltransferase family 9 protein [Deltaproteobacteria bacterium]
MTEYKTDCRLFTGFSPCQFRRSCADCPHYAPVGERVLLIQLDALGDVLRMTALLPAIRRAYRDAHITWLTRGESAPLLANNPLVDRVLLLGDATVATLEALSFDRVLCPEKSVPACALLDVARAPVKKGFGLDAGGAIVPLDEDAEPLYRLGLDNHAKFFENESSAQELAARAVGLPWHGERYVVVLDDEERAVARADREAARVRDDEVLIGWNNGCGPRYPYKRLLVDDQVMLMKATWERLTAKERTGFALLGGGTGDGERNREVARRLAHEGIAVTETPTTAGLRRGLASVAGCDMVFSGDTLGLHMAIGLRKPVVAWFGITCHQEIEVFGRGVKVLADVPCRPCWLQSCDLETKCYRSLPWDDVASAVAEMAGGLLRDGSWEGELLIGELLREDRVPPPLGNSPGPILHVL